MIAFNPLATVEYHRSIRRMQEEHYDSRAISKHIDEIETGLLKIDADPGKTGKAKPWGEYPDARHYGPTPTCGFYIRFLPTHQGRPVVMAIVSGLRRPEFGSRRKPI